MSFENNNLSLHQWADKNIPQSKMNKLIMDYLVTGRN